MAPQPGQRPASEFDLLPERWYRLIRAEGVPKPIRPELVWTEEVVHKIAARHAVTIEEVQEAFEDPHALITRGR